MERATISDNVTLAGMYEHIEIWPTGEWNKRVENDLTNYGEMLYEAADRMRAETGLGGPVNR
jgi:DNA-binding transcriptional regulator/RsmH inhibitor MraZ